MEIPRTAPDHAPMHDPLKPNVDKPDAARMYDWYLGGVSNTEVDRQYAAKVLDQVPFVRPFAFANRRFLTRCVHALSDWGVRQFIDIGCGIPTFEPVHQTAWKKNPQAKVCYVDYAPVAVAHMKQRLEETDDPGCSRSAVLCEDVRNAEAILDAASGLLDFSQPIGLLVVATLHFVGPGDRPQELIARYREALPAGSYFAASHLTIDGVSEEMRQQGEVLEKMYADTPSPGYFRDRPGFEALFEGFDLVEPGVVWAPQWRPDDATEPDPWKTATLVAVGRKP